MNTFEQEFHDEIHDERAKERRLAQGRIAQAERKAVAENANARLRKMREAKIEAENAERYRRERDEAQESNDDLRKELLAMMAERQKAEKAA